MCIRDSDMAADQRLAAGQADLLDAEPCEYARKPRNLFKRQQFLVLEELIILAEHFFRHAIHATKIAAVGHRDTQVAQRPSPPVGDVALVGCCRKYRIVQALLRMAS